MLNIATKKIKIPIRFQIVRWFAYDLVLLNIISKIMKLIYTMHLIWHSYNFLTFISSRVILRNFNFSNLYHILIGL